MATCLILKYTLVMALILTSIADLHMGLGAIEQLVLALYEPAECIDVFINFREDMLGLENKIWAELWLQFRYSCFPRDAESGLYSPCLSDLIIIGIHRPCDIPNQYGRFAFVLELSVYCAKILPLHSLQRIYWALGCSMLGHCTALTPASYHG